MKSLSFVVLLLLTSCLTLFSQLKSPNISSEDNNLSNFQNNSGVKYDAVLIDTTGAVTKLTGFWDYVTNGNNLKKLLVTHDTIVVSADQTDSINTSVSGSRYSYYNFSTNGGISWNQYPLPIHSGHSAYTDLNLYYYSPFGNNISASGRYFNSSGSSRGYVGRDLIFGIGSFSIYEPSNYTRDIFSVKVSSYVLACVYRSLTGDSVKFTKFDCNTHMFTPSILIVPDVGNNLRYYIGSNDSNDIFVMWWDPVDLDQRMLGRRSTDGGNTFSTTQIVMTYDTYVNYNEVCPWLSADIIYKKGTNIFGVALSTYPAYMEDYAKGCKIVYWSPYLSGYKVIADWTNHPVLSDVNFFNNSGTSIQVGMNAVSHPSLAYSDDRSRLFCVFSAVQKDSTTYNFLYNDIWMSYSDNDGNTWSVPVNLTNTQNSDEIYPSLSKTGNTQNLLNITYSLSACPGSASFVDTLTPRCKVYQIYKKCNFVTGNCAGVIVPVNTISNDVPQKYFISQNYPNPFNPSTNILFGLPKSCKVKLIIYDALGKEIKRLADGYLNPGSYEISWNSEGFASGIYFYSLQTEEFTQTKKMILLK